jgi:flagellar basal-body rod modification protein FlgD
MTTVTSATQAGTATGSTTAASPTSATSAADMETTFLKLLVAQLQNQDPLSPMDNSQITSQMAQISTVSGIQQLNTTIQSLTGQQTAADQVQAAALVGHQVMVAGSTLPLASNSAVGGFSLGQSVDQLTVTVLDSSGNVVHTANLGAQNAGMHTFQWDGTTDSGTSAPDGTYTFKVSGLAAGVAVSPQAMEVASVYGVVPSTTGSPTLDLGSLGTTTISNVQQIF